MFTKLVDNIYILYSNDSEKNRIILYLKNYNIKYTLFKSDITFTEFNKQYIKTDYYFNMYLKFYKNYKLNKNQISHINSIKNILNDSKKNNYKSILILEYDIYFHKNIKEKLKEYKNTIKNTDIIHLGSSQHFWYNPVTKTLIDFKDMYYINNHSLGTFAIILKSNVFDTYISYLSTYSLPSDIILTIISQKFNSIVIFPNIIICDVSKSTILHNRNELTTFIKFKWNKNNYLV
jgi:hypothetical protein